MGIRRVIIIMSVEICYSVVSSPRLALQHFKGLAPVRKIKSALTAAKNGNSQRELKEYVSDFK